MYVSPKEKGRTISVLESVLQHESFYHTLYKPYEEAINMKIATYGLLQAFKQKKS